MSIESLALVLHHSPATGSDKVILIGIANHDGDAGSFPSIATLMTYSNTSERAVQDSLRRLEASGQIAVHVNGGGTRQTRADRRPNMYEVLVRCPADCDRTANHRTADGVQSSVDGVQVSVERGAVERIDGVRSTAPEPSLNHPEEPSLFGYADDETEPTPHLSVVSDDGTPKKPAPKKRSQLPPDWRPTETHRVYVDAHGLNGGVQLEKFKGHHLAKGSTFLSWDQAFSNWLRTAVGYGEGSAPTAAPPQEENRWMRRRPSEGAR